MSDLPQEHLTELLDETKSEKNRLDYLTKIRGEFSQMTRQELMDKIIIAYDELNKTSEQLRNERDLFYTLFKDFSKSNDKIYELKFTLRSFGYTECGECGEWRVKE